MLVINRLTRAGDIKKIVLRQDEITITTLDNNIIIFRRVADNGRTEETNTTLPYLQEDDILAKE